MLSVLRNLDQIDETQFLLFGGKLTRADRAAKGLPTEPDVVFADLLKTLGATATASENDELHQVMRRATGYGQIRTNRKARFAGALRSPPVPCGRRRAPGRQHNARGDASVGVALDGGVGEH